MWSPTGPSVTVTPAGSTLLAKSCPHQGDAVGRLGDPHMIVVDGVCVFSDEKDPYRVRIIDE